MATLNASVVDSFIAAIAAGAAESAAAYARTFGGSVTITTGASGPFDVSLFNAEHYNSGLALLLEANGEGIAILIPSSSGLVPSWCETPDATGKSKLATFAQEWGMNMLPDDFFPDNCQAAVITSLADAVKQDAKLGADPGYVELKIEHDGKTSSAFVLWPLTEPSKLLAHIVVPAAAGPAPLTPPTLQAPSLSGPLPPIGNFVGMGAPMHENGAKRLTQEDLPGFSHSLLKVCLPVAVVLARKREPIKKILELGVGSIIQFDKSSDEMIDLEVDRTIVGSGEAVKVGEMFGLRISAIHLPAERFRMVEVRRDGEYRAQTAPHQIIGKAPIRSLEPTA
ncbi:MAG: FliM/FliN family flagellar motor switch protein [Thermoguttaceae bacterium]